MSGYETRQWEARWQRRRDEAGLFRDDGRIVSHLEGRRVYKVVHVPDRLLNLVVS